MSADGLGSPVRLTRHPGRESSPGFTPDGTLGFERDGWIVGLRHGRLINVRLGADPAWSSDNTYLAFVADRGIHLTLGQSARRIAAGMFPAWSPDGTRLVDGSPNGRLEAVTILGLATQRITTGARTTEDISPSWRP